MFKIITVPFDRNTRGFEDELLNLAVTNKQVKSHQAEFFEDSEDKYWTCFFACEPIAAPTSKPITEKLKQWCKERADREGEGLRKLAQIRPLEAILDPRSVRALRINNLRSI